MTARVLDDEFRFETKAQNLAQLVGRIATAKICDLEILTVGAWHRAPDDVLARVQDRFPAQPIIFRSSAFGEDSLESSQAGAFESVGDVDSSHREAMRNAIEEVIESYRVAGSDADVPDDAEILVQPMLRDVAVSGVLFTRDLEKNAPYYVLNYDDQTGSTHTVTSGSGDGETVLRVYRDVDLGTVDDNVRRPLALARELELVTGSDALDIEYAIDAAGDLFLLQVRPLARTKILSFERIDRRFSSEIESMRRFVDVRSRPRPGLLGSTTILGEMPDWNPAEIIGTQPKPLASSLYRHLIMKDVWRDARGLLGYRNPVPHQLMVTVGGRPYVDVRSSFNSLIPAAIPDELAEKLVDHYLRRLAENPDFHDKVEFEILITCLTLDFESDAARLEDDGFTTAEIDLVRRALLELTDAVVQDQHGVLAELEDCVDALTARREAVLEWCRSVDDIPSAVEQLLDGCITFGTLPFSVFARNAFIGSAFLKSLVNRNVVTPAEHDRYLLSIDTVASDFVADLDACVAGRLDRTEFLGRYGHLRPGTYDITAFTYGERPDMYLTLGEQAAATDTPDDVPAVHPAEADHTLAEGVRAAATELIDAYGFTFSWSQLDTFIRRSIQLREFLKFEFTKNLSAALTLVGEFGAHHGLTRMDMAFVNIEQFLEFSNNDTSDPVLAALRESIERNKKRYELTSLINLPDLIFSSADVEVVALQQRRPNFITQQKVVAGAYELDIVSDRIDIEGRIVLIENADPGFDWVFSRNIAGLVTKYGGAASHLAIRCSEFGVPAAIGCGEQIYSSLRAADRIDLDCMEQRITAL